MSDVLVALGIILVLVLLNGLFVAAEFAIIATPRPAALAAARGGNRAARRVHDVLADPRRQDRYIATAQVGITLASLGLGMYGEHALAEWLAPRVGFLGGASFVGTHVLASVLAIAGLTYLHIVLGEMVPKALALQHPFQTAQAVASPMMWSKRVAYPVVVSLNALGNLLLRLVGVRRERTSSHYHSTGEIRLLIEESRKGGQLRAEEKRLLHEALSFSELRASDVMVPRVNVAGIPLGATPGEIEEIVRARPHTRYPVYTGSLDSVLGSVHVRNLLRARLEDRPLAASDLKSVPFIPQTASLEDVLETLRLKGAHMAVVMDEHGGTQGVLTVEDLLEEVAGDIREDAALPAAPAGGALVVPGTLRLDELSRRLGRPLDHPEVDTVSGLVLALLERPPLVGDRVEHEGVGFSVASVAGRGVRTCLIHPPQEAMDPGEGIGRGRAGGP